MAKRTYNRGVSYNGLSNSKLKSLQGSNFNFTKFGGINSNKNYVTIDQQSFQEAHNVYVDENDQLHLRPVTKEYSLIPDNYDVIGIEKIGSTTIYESYRNDNVTDLAIVLNDELVIVSSDWTVSKNHKICKWNEIYVIFCENNIYGFSINNGTVNKYTSTDLIYIPETKTISGTTVKENTFSKNIFTSSERVTYLFTKSVETDTTGLIGKNVYIEIDGKQYYFTFVSGSDDVFVEKLGTVQFDNIYKGTYGDSSVWMSVADYPNDDGVYISKDGKVFSFIAYPEYALSYTMRVSYESGSVTETFASRRKPVLSDDGLSVFLYTNCQDVTPATGFSSDVTSWQQLRIYKLDTRTLSWSSIQVVPYKNFVRTDEFIVRANSKRSNSTIGVTIECEVNLYYCFRDRSNTFYSSVYPYAQNTEVDLPIIGHSPDENCVAFYVPIKMFFAKQVITSRDDGTSDTNDSLNIINGHVLIYINQTDNTYVCFPTMSSVSKEQIIAKQDGNVYLGYAMKNAFIKNNPTDGIPIQFTVTSQWTSTEFSIGITNSISDQSGQTGKFNVYQSSNTYLLQSVSIGTTSDTYYETYLYRNENSALTDKQLYVTDWNRMSYEDRETFSVKYTTNVGDSSKTTINNNGVPTKSLVVNTGAIVASGYYYSLTSKQNVPMIQLDNNILPYWVSSDGTSFEYYSNGNTYTNNYTNVISISVVTEGQNNYYVPSFIQEFITNTVVIGNSLYQSSEIERNKIYVPEDTKVSFIDDITNIVPFSQYSLGVFLKDNVYEYQYDSSLTSSLGINTFRLTPTKLNLGCIKGSDVLIGYDGTTIFVTNLKGFVGLSYQNFVQSTEQIFNYLSENITDLYREWSNNYEGQIKLYQYKDYVFLYQQNNNIMLVFDLRNGIWWKWSFTFPCEKMIYNDDELLVLFNNKLRKLDFYDNESVHDYDTSFVDWKIKSQMIHFGAPNNYKHVLRLSIISHTLAKEFAYKLKFTNYRNLNNTEDTDVVKFDVSTLTTVIKRVTFMKTNAFQFEIESDEKLTKFPIITPDIVIRYRVTEEVR